MRYMRAALNRAGHNEPIGPQPLLALRPRVVLQLAHLGRGPPAAGLLGHMRAHLRTLGIVDNTAPRGEGDGIPASDSKTGHAMAMGIRRVRRCQPLYGLASLCAVIVQLA